MDDQDMSVTCTRPIGLSPVSLLDLPSDVLRAILCLLDALPLLLAVSLVCKKFRLLCLQSVTRFLVPKRFPALLLKKFPSIEELTVSLLTIPRLWSIPVAFPLSLTSLALLAPSSGDERRLSYPQPDLIKCFTKLNSLRSFAMLAVDNAEQNALPILLASRSSLAHLWLAFSEVPSNFLNGISFPALRSLTLHAPHPAFAPFVAAHASQLRALSLHGALRFTGATRSSEDFFTSLGLLKFPNLQQVNSETDYVPADVLLRICSSAEHPPKLSLKLSHRYDTALTSLEPLSPFVCSFTFGGWPPPVQQWLLYPHLSSVHRVTLIAPRDLLGLATSEQRTLVASLVLTLADFDVSKLVEFPRLTSLSVHYTTCVDTLLQAHTLSLPHLRSVTLDELSSLPVQLPLLVALIARCPRLEEIFVHFNAAPSPADHAAIEAFLRQVNSDRQLRACTFRVLDSFLDEFVRPVLPWVSVKVE